MSDHVSLEVALISLQMTITNAVNRAPHGWLTASCKAIKKIVPVARAKWVWGSLRCIASLTLQAVEHRTDVYTKKMKIEYFHEVSYV